MSSSRALRCLDANAQAGDIEDINIRWGESAQKSLVEAANILQQPVATVKAVTESVLFYSAKRLGHKTVKISGPPHSFSYDSTTGEQIQDLEHVTAQMSAGKLGGRSKVHVYLDGKWPNPATTAESVVRRDGWDSKLSYGYTSADLAASAAASSSKSAAVTSAPSSSSSYYASSTATSSSYATGAGSDPAYQAYYATSAAQPTYATTSSMNPASQAHYAPTTTGSGSSSSYTTTASSQPQVTDWELAADGQTYQRYNFTTGQWEFYQH